MERTGSINAAGDFLRALRSGRGGGQSAGGPMPVKALLILLADRGEQPVDEVGRALTVDAETTARTIANLDDLGLVRVRGGAEHDLISLTELGKEVAEQRRD